MIFKAIQNDNGNDKKALKDLFLLFCIVFIISIQYDSINVSFYIEMDDKNDKKGEFSVLYHFFIILTIFSVSFQDR